MCLCVWNGGVNVHVARLTGQCVSICLYDYLGLLEPIKVDTDVLDVNLSLSRPRLVSEHSESCT